MWPKLYINELSKITQTLMDGDGNTLVSLVIVALEEGRAANLDRILIVNKVR